MCVWQVVAGCLTGEHGKAHVNIFNDDENIQSELAAAQRNMLQVTLLFDSCGGGGAAEEAEAAALKPKHGRVFCGGTSAAASSSAEVCAVHISCSTCVYCGSTLYLNLLRSGAHMMR